MREGRDEANRMRAAVLADIHGNLAALETVLADIGLKGGADEIWCLGDIVGYGPDPHECIETVQKRCTVCVAGNHDWAAIGKIDTSDFNPEAAEAAQWTARHLKPEDVLYLRSLPLTAEKGDFTLAHGSPRDPIWEYILSVYEAEESLKYFQTPYCLVGHSHLPLVFQCEKRCRLSEPEDGTRINLGEKRLIINPGGVGQPRDNDPRAAYAIYDREAAVVTLHRVKYDFTVTQGKMEAAGLPFWLISRLAYGR
jgi:diadenosine tetraphosphatase ApaH/serine/threonine PP2A family protein phosphatase